VHFEAHSCPGTSADPEGTCEEVAADLATADSCMQAVACCSAVNDSSSAACTRAAEPACQSGPELPSSFTCGTDDGCHVDTDCHDGHVHFEAHSCPGESADPEGTCEEVAADLVTADSCMQAVACCSAVNNSANAACTRAAACQPAPELPSSFSCGTDDGCHVDTDCHGGHVHFEAHSCPGTSADPEGTCEEVAADLVTADSCMQATACCSAVNDTSSEACVRSAACQMKVVV